ncbi:hypothetical protein Aph01nite_32220 [Acrocarpospora phusangensis]|uniref:Uncharacterized protein n=1 Tax=Acrocarpospora phusangensis TaxID=1070424 RepID=A0A919QER0_9ACTN|nr:hypothetical protein [Acrocarpospora phusangensis]GIH24912.1 hypothetical protein Aph01nite_32220 [Acrocarpospora phusangensis]
MAFPLDLLPCPASGDVILVPRGLVHARLTPADRRELIEQLQALDLRESPRESLACLAG